MSNAQAKEKKMGWEGARQVEIDKPTMAARAKLEWGTVKRMGIFSLAFIGLLHLSVYTSKSGSQSLSGSNCSDFDPDPDSKSVNYFPSKVKDAPLGILHLSVYTSKSGSLSGSGSNCSNFDPGPDSKSVNYFPSKMKDANLCHISTQTV